MDKYPNTGKLPPLEDFETIYQRVTAGVPMEEEFQKVITNMKQTPQELEWREQESIRLKERLSRIPLRDRKIENEMVKCDYDDAKAVAATRFGNLCQHCYDGLIKYDIETEKHYDEVREEARYPHYWQCRRELHGKAIKREEHDRRFRAALLLKKRLMGIPWYVDRDKNQGMGFWLGLQGSAVLNNEDGTCVNAEDIHLVPISEIPVEPPDNDFHDGPQLNNDNQ